MLRLFKLAIYGVLCYVAYEFFQGLTSGDSTSAAKKGGRRSTRRDLDGALNTGGGRMTGAGTGMRQEVSDESGAARTERVGRGAASRPR